MKRVILALLTAGLLASPADAFIWVVGNPPGLRPWQHRSTFSVRGLVVGFRLTPIHGPTRHVPLPRPKPLGADLDLPPGDWAELTLELAGPVTVVPDAGAAVSLDLDALTVVLDDPDAATVRIEWALSEQTLEALAAGASVPDLAWELEESALAVGR